MSLIKVNNRGQGVPIKNLIVNGNFEVDQRGTLASPATSASTNYPRSVDANWLGVEQTDGQISLGKVADAPAGTGLQSSFKVTVTSADTSLAAGQRVCPSHSVEASTWQHLDWHTTNAKPIAVQFWVKSSITGTFGFTFRTGGAGMSYTHPYTISSANTWEKKTFTVAGPTSVLGGSVGSGNGIMYYIVFGLGLGTSFDTGANGAWTAVGNGQGRSSHTSLIATNGATWQMTGFQIEEGTVHSDFVHEPFEENLRKCQRYFYKFINSGLSDQYNFYSPYSPAQITAGLPNSSAICPMTFPTTMRAAPTMATTLSSGTLNRQTSTPFGYVAQIGTTSTGTHYITQYLAAAEL